MVTSQNGYSANDVTLTQSYKIPGTTRAVRLRKGSPGQILVRWAAWFDANVEPIDVGQLDDWGYAERPIRGGTQLSNHASGTAIDLNSAKHPLAARGTFTPAQTARIRTELRQYGGCIRWGGDYANRADEMHFEIVKDQHACDAMLVLLNQQEEGFTVTQAEIVMAELRRQGDATRQEVRRQAIWMLRYGVQIADDLESAATKYDAARAAGKTEAEAEAIYSASMSAVTADLEKRARTNG